MRYMREGGYSLLTLYNAARLRHTFCHFMILFTLLLVTAATCHGSDCKLIVGVRFVQ